MLPTKNRPPSAKGKAVGIGFEQVQYTTASSVHAIALALSFRPTGPNSYQGTCIICNYPNSLSLTERDGRLLWHCHACGNDQAVRHSLMAAGLLGRDAVYASAARHSPVAQKRQLASSPEKLAYIRKLWGDALLLPDTVAAHYLANRGLAAPYPLTLRFAPACRHTPTASHGPAMVAAVTRWPDKQPVAIHRTYLLPDGGGKINHPQARMMLGNATGGAVRLAPYGERLGIAEGIETALSVQQATGLPMWACLSTSGLQNIILPDDVREVVICADNDANCAGQYAAKAAAERLLRMDKKVKIAQPPQSGHDFNDMLKGGRYA